MPRLRTYNVFISHSWKYDIHYYRLVDLLNSAYHFKWKNYSVPSDDPLAGKSKVKLAREISNQIRFASIVLVICGMYVSYREWIQYEIDIADKFNKPIVGIMPRGNSNLPSALNRDDIEIVGWNTKSIISAIRRNAL